MVDDLAHFAVIYSTLGTGRRILRLSRSNASFRLLMNS